MKQQKWSGLKLSKKELEKIRKEEKYELIAELAGFFIALGFIAFCLIACLFIAWSIK